jgi:small subunit ribosomal protein S19
MSRSLKKGPYASEKLVKRIAAMTYSGEKRVVKTWARSTTILPEFIGHTLAVHTGSRFIPVYVSENMVGHKVGEFAPTRNFRGHTTKTKAQMAGGKAKS